MKFGIEDHHIMKLPSFDFAEIGALKVAFYLGVQMNVCPYCLNFLLTGVKFGTGDAHKHLLSYYEFSDNCCSGNTSLEGVNKFLACFPY